MSKNWKKTTEEQENVERSTSQETIREEQEMQSESCGREKEEESVEQPEKAADSEKAEESAPAADDKLAECEATIARLTDQNLRQMAEFDNYRKRTMKEKAELIKNASADVITKILPVIDDMERAIENSAKSDDISAIREGEQLIYSKLMHILEGEGLRKIPAKGEQFDTDVHEAVAIIPAAGDNAKNTVIDCTRDGYLLNDKLLRAAQVVVAN